MIKAVFFDIDGTLVSMSTHKLSSKSKEAILTLQKNKIKTFISTGRHMAEIKNSKLLDPLVFDGYVLLNGQYCTTGDLVIHENPIHPDDIKGVLTLLEQKPFPCMFMEDNQIYMNYVNDFVRAEQDKIAAHIPPVADINRALSHPIYQVIPFFGMELEADLMKYMPNCSITRWSDAVVDVVPIDGNKKVGVHRMLDHFQILPDECMSIGDGSNDIEMLAFSGLGVAMGNSPEEVKAAADYITLDVDKDGVFHALSHFGLI